MTAQTTDKFRKVAASTVTTLAAPGKAMSATSLTVGSTTNYPTDTGITVAIRVVDSNGDLVAGTYTEWNATVTSSTTLAIVATPVYGSDQVYAAGSTTQVFMPVSSHEHNLMVDGITNQHAQDGTHTAVTATSLAVSGAAAVTGATTLTGALTVKSYDGWITETRTWTYASGATTNVGTFTVAGVDLTGVYNVGDRVKFTQTTVKYGIITKVAFSTDTTVTIYMGTDYTIANAAITLPFYSHQKNPVGFNSDPAKWTITTNSTSDRSTSSTTFVTLTDNIVLPIGSWSVRPKLFVYVTTASANEGNTIVTLSSDASTETNTEFTMGLRTRDSGNPGTNSAGNTVSTIETVTVAAQTTFTLIGKTSVGTMSVFGSTVHPTRIKAVCAYL